MKVTMLTSEFMSKRVEKLVLNNSNLSISTPFQSFVKEESLMKRLEYIGAINVYPHDAGSLIQVPTELVLRSANANGTGNFPNLTAEHFNFQQVRSLSVGRPDDAEMIRILQLVSASI